jgi:hypothetical protein
MRLFKSSKKNESITDQISRVLTQEKFNFNKHTDAENKEIIRLGMALESGNADCFVVLNHEKSLVEFLCISPIKIPENKRLEVGKFFHMINGISYFGILEVDFRDGMIRVKTCFIYHEEDFTSDETLRTYLFVGWDMYDRYFPEIMKIVYGQQDADSAFHSLFNNVNPKLN